jgi:hypothetical protein
VEGLDDVVVVGGGLGPLDDDGTRGWVGDGFARCGMVVGGIVGVIGVSDDSLVVGWLGSGHSVLGGLGLQAVPGGV